MGNSHGHNSTRAEPSSPSHNPEEMHDGGDKSVLQAKLTNLAIQIGYAGKERKKYETQPETKNFDSIVLILNNVMQYCSV